MCRYILYRFLSVFILLLIFLNISYASDYSLESFDNSINTNFWTTTRGLLAFNTDLSQTYAVIQTPNGENPFQYFKSKGLLEINPDFNAINLRLKFSSSAVTQGAGYIFSDNTPDLSNSLNFSSFLFFIWPKPDGSYHLFTTLCHRDNPVCNPNTQLINGVFSMPNDDEWHTVSFLRVDDKYSVFLDNQNIFETNPVLRQISSIGVGNPENTTGNQTWPVLFIDYIGLDTVQEYFPHYSQYDERWAETEYDHAGVWLGGGETGIGRWGCALTSAAMILKSYGVKTLDGAEVTPANLNDWLNSQDDGYMSFGYLNWIAVSRFARESYEAGKSETKLEYVREYDQSNIELPAVISYSGHFVVAHRENETEWIVNDPRYTETTTLPKTQYLNSINRFVPSETDLSYLQFVAREGLELSLEKRDGPVVPISWVSEYLAGEGEESPRSVFGYLAKPESGRYLLRVDNPSETTRTLSINLYDNLGNPAMFSFDIPGMSEYVYEIVFDKDPAKTRSAALLDLIAPPTPTPISPSNGSIVNTASLVLTWSEVDDPSGPVTYQYRSSWDGGSFGPVSTGTKSFINAPGTPDNIYIWQVRACDSADNCSEWSSSSLTVDSTPPLSPTISHPTEGWATRSTPILNSWTTVSDNTGIAYYRVEYAYDDHHTFSNAPYRTTNSTSRNHTPALWEQGGVSFRVQAFDLAGNEGAWSEWRHYIYDATAPSSPGIPTSSALSNSLVQNWVWSPASDTGGSGIDGYYARVYDATSDILGEWYWIGDVLTTSTTLSKGLWQLDLKARDKAANESGVVRSASLEIGQKTPIYIGKTLFHGWYGSEQTSYFYFDDNSHLSCMITTEGKNQKCSVNTHEAMLSSHPISIDLTRPQVYIDIWGRAISGRASDALSGIERVELLLTKPGKIEETITAHGNTNWSYTIPDAPLGSYKVKVVAYDKAGNASEQVSRDYTINPTNSSTTSGAVAGASITQDHEDLSSVKEKELDLTEDRRENSVTSNPQVLGEETTAVQNTPSYLYLLLLLGLMGVVVIIFLIKRRS